MRKSGHCLDVDSTEVAKLADYIRGVTDQLDNDSAPELINESLVREIKELRQWIWKQLWGPGFPARKWFLLVQPAGVGDVLRFPKSRELTLRDIAQVTHVKTFKG